MRWSFKPSWPSTAERRACQASGIARPYVAAKRLQALQAQPEVPLVAYYFSYLAHHRNETTARILDISQRTLQAAGFFSGLNTSPNPGEGS